MAYCISNLIQSVYRLIDDGEGTSLKYDVDVGNFKFVNIVIDEESDYDRLIFNIYKVLGTPMTPETEETLLGSNDYYVSELDRDSGSQALVVIDKNNNIYIKGDKEIAHLVVNEMQKRIE